MLDCCRTRGAGHTPFPGVGSGSSEIHEAQGRWCIPGCSFTGTAWIFPYIFIPSLAVRECGQCSAVPLAFLSGSHIGNCPQGAQGWHPWCQCCILGPSTRTCCHHWYMSQTALTLLCGCCGAGQTDGPLSSASSCPNRIQLRIQTLCSTDFIVYP